MDALARVSMQSISLRDLPFIQCSIFFLPWSGFAVLNQGMFVQISLLFMALAVVTDLPRLVFAGAASRVVQYRHLFWLALFLVCVALSFFKWDLTLEYANQTMFGNGIRQTVSLSVGLFFYFAVFLSVQNWNDVRQALKVYAYGAVPAFVFGAFEILNILLDGDLVPFLSLFQSKNLGYGMTTLQGTGLPRLTLLAQEATNGCIWAMSLVALVVAYRLVNSSTEVKRLIPKWIGILAIVFSVLTLAKAIIFAVSAIVLIVYLFHKYNKSIRLRGILNFSLMVGSLIALVVIGYLIYRITQISSGLSLDDISTWTRFHNLLVGLNMVADNPILGVGWGGFTHQYGNYLVEGFPLAGNPELLSHFNDTGEFGFLSPYNFYVHIAAEAGILAALIFIVFLIGPALRILKRTAHESNDKNVLALGTVMGLAVLMSGGFSYVSFSLYYFWFFLALCHSVDSLQSSEKSLN